jgi:hypothetical protein
LLNWIIIVTNEKLRGKNGIYSLKNHGVPFGKTKSPRKLGCLLGN